MSVIADIRVTKRFSFHKGCVRTVQALYTDPVARIKVNGTLSKVIRLGEGAVKAAQSAHSYLPSSWSCSVSGLTSAVVLKV